MTRAPLPHRRAFSLAWPAIVGNVTVPLVGLVDTAMLGHFSTATHIGAVALGSTVLSALMWLVGFLRTGTTSLVGRARGAGRDDAALTHAQRAALLAVALGAGALVLQWIAIPALMSVLAPAGDVRELAIQYAWIRMTSVPAALLTLVVSGWFVGSGDTRRPLAIVATVNVVNLGLDVAFVGGLGWNSAGAAWATVIAEWLGLALALVLWWRAASSPLRAGARRWRGRGLRSGWRRLMAMNTDLVIRTAILYSVLTFVTAYGARLGPEILAANAILMQLMLLASYGQDGYAHAAEAMVAREIGARDVSAFHRAVAASALPAVGIGAAFSLLYLVASGPFVSVLTSLPEVTAAVDDYIGWVVWLPLVSAGAYLFDGVFLGSGRTRAMAWTMAASVIVVFVPVLLAGLAWIPDGRNHDLWRAFLLFNAARGVFLGIAYWRITRRRAWLHAAEA
ncbi:MATE family efflux transporter [Demequina lignilytica]|uniref:MATE family efflux transporter n=1 Tax=Demequina lignilytica TaxID=3051663 RepID=A0AB35MFH9_9MICO|nr:MATE family efflux transporter [Demequina sp. SYSU T0a273]MDN4482493.1 MATE family efflux transporter [Demequina sp. SYSU T0a273]